MNDLPQEIIRLVLARVLCDNTCRVCKYWLRLIDSLQPDVVREYVNKHIADINNMGRKDIPRYMIPPARLYKMMTLEQQITIPNILQRYWGNLYIVGYRYPIDWSVVRKQVHSDHWKLMDRAYPYMSTFEAYFTSMFLRYEQYRRYIVIKYPWVATQSIRTKWFDASKSDTYGVMRNLCVQAIWKLVYDGPSVPLLREISLEI